MAICQCGAFTCPGERRRRASANLLASERAGCQALRRWTVATQETRSLLPMSSDWLLSTGRQRTVDSLARSSPVGGF
jgi:hypothetical protein